MSDYLYHFQPDGSAGLTLCGVQPGRANTTSAIDRACWASLFARILRDGKPVCEECFVHFEAYLEERPGLARRFDLKAVE